MIANSIANGIQTLRIDFKLTLTMFYEVVFQLTNNFTSH